VLYSLLEAEVIGYYMVNIAIIYSEIYLRLMKIFNVLTIQEEEHHHVNNTCI